ncbi:MAG: MlaD family protein [Bacteroidota bacterium]
MQKQSVNKIKLGIFITIGIVLFLVGIYFIGETKKIFSSTFRISARFKDVNGLQVGNNVRFAGINVGTIENIEIITDSTVQVDMIVDTKTQKFIKKDAKAIIGSDGLMGNKIMNISAGTTGKPLIENNDIIGTTIPVSMDDLLAKLKTTSDNAALITSDLAAVIGNIRSGKGTIGKLFMDTVFAENLDKTIVNVKQGTKGFKQNMDAAKNSFLLRGFFKKKEKQEKETEKPETEKKK